MTDGTSLARLERQVEADPEGLDVRALCRHLASDDYDVSTRASDVRDDLVANASRPEVIVGRLRELLADPDDDVRREAVGTLHRVIRIWPRDLAPLVAADLSADDHRRRAGAANVFCCVAGGVARPYVPALVELLDDPDPRVAAIGLSALASIAQSFPGAVVDLVPDVLTYLDDEWMPDDGSGLQIVYDRSDREADPESGEPAGERLTHGVKRPFEDALALVNEVARSRPAAVEPAVARLRELLVEAPDRHLGTVIEVLTSVARDDPAAVEPVEDALRRYATDDRQYVRVPARNLLAVLGVELSRPEPVSPPAAMADRDRESAEADDDLLAHVDQRVMEGEVDLDDLLPLLRCTDPETRDTAAWGLSCGWRSIEPTVHERADQFLALLDEPHDCTRTHLHQILSGVAAAYPEQWTPALVELSGHDDPIVREQAVGGLASAAGDAPELVVRHDDALVARLNDEPGVRAGAFLALAALAPATPGKIDHLRSRAVDALSASTPAGAWGFSPRFGALRYLAAMARVDVERAVPAVDPVVALVADLAGPEAIVERSRWGRERHVDDVGEPERALQAALGLCAGIATEKPDAVASVRADAERVLDDRYVGYKEALNLLAALDAA